MKRSVAEHSEDEWC